MRAIHWLIIWALIVVCSGCGGSEPGGLAPLAKAAPSAAGQDGPQASDAVWQNLIAQQQAGSAQFNPHQIMLIYREPAQLAPLAQLPAPGSIVAATLPNPTLRQNKQYEPVTDAIAAAYGLRIRQQVYRGELNLASFDLPDGLDAQQTLSRIRTSYAGQVAYALLSPRRQKHYAPNDPDYSLGPFGPLWDRWQIHCGSGWDISLGSPAVRIAVVDTGVRITHEELAAQVINPATELPAAYCDIVNGDKTVEDTDGHGTFIAGVIAAEADNGSTLVGVAPHCRVLPIKISNDGSADSADIVAGCLLAADLGARVVNLSFGGTEQVPAEESMVNQLTGAGVLFVGSAGNDGVYAASYPAAYANALCVGATDYNDDCTDFSNWGLAVDLAAPGMDLKSCSIISNTSYETGWDGTSFAAPMVAAAAGLLWSYDSGLTLDEVRDALEHHGYPAWGFATLLVRLDLVAAFGAVVEPVTPTITGLSVAAGHVWGAVPAKPLLSVQLLGAQNVKQASYTLDLPPLDADEGEDLHLESEAAPGFAVQFTVPSAGNQTAVLRAELTSPTNTAGLPTTAVQYIFNQRGDVNADGAVNLLDAEAYAPVLGLRTGDAGYLPFFDSDLDGVITELDASAVGYFFNGLLPVPEVLNVTPTTGYSGQLVTLDADVEGAEPLTYAWDLGGGATPNTSAEIAPTITLAATGSYPAKLTLSNVYGEFSYDFNLAVTDRPAPTASFSASPRNGPPPLEVNFDARDSFAADGAIVNYQWSWDGDEAWEFASASPAAAHTFDILGSYPVRLRVTDEQGLTGDTTLQVRVAEKPTYENWGEYELGLWGQWVSNDNIRLSTARVDGRTAIVWAEKVNGTILALHLAWAENSAPLSAAEWQITELPGDNVNEKICLANCGDRFAFACADGVGLYYKEWDGTAISTVEVASFDSNPNYRYVALAEIGGKPALLFYAALNGEEEASLHYAYSTVSQPAATTDWIVSGVGVTNVRFDYPYSYNIQLVELNGKPYAQARGRATTSYVRVLMYADSPTPQAGDWHGYELPDEDDNNSCGFLYTHAAKPALLYCSEVGNNGGIYAASQQAFPTSATDWLSYEVYHNVYWHIRCGAEIGGVPVMLAFNRISSTDTSEIWIADSAEPMDASAWQRYEMPDAQHEDNRRVVDHDGYPAMLAVIENGYDDWRLVYRYPY